MDFIMTHNFINVEAARVAVSTKALYGHAAKRHAVRATRYDPSRERRRTRLPEMLKCAIVFHHAINSFV